MKKNQTFFTKKKGADGKPALNSVPTIIVNNKFRINPSALDRDNFEEDYKELVKHLLTLK
jgi:thiol:disulfide interchange protein DsbA